MGNPVNPIVQVLKDITVAVGFCTSFCAARSVPISVTVVVTCADGLSHEYERHVE